MNGIKLAFVLPRYGSSLGGGAEALGRAIALALKDPVKNPGILPVETIEVWTTCATDHRTWENALPPGDTLEDGIVVRRFPVDERSLDVFITAEHSIAAGRALSINEQLGWLASGVNSNGLYRHIAMHGESFNALLFAPYLFPTSFWGPLIYPERSWLIPCLHNEAYAFLEVFRVVFNKAAGLLFNAPPEMELAASIFGKELVYSKGKVVGMGFDQPEPVSVDGSDKPYLLYSGRKEQGKNLDKLISWFGGVRTSFPELELRIIGSGDIHFLRELPAGVIDLGFVSETEKRSLMKGAVALCQPSTNESFSIVLMEAWLEGTPVLVHGSCDVTRDHAVRSGGGLFFSTKDEFVGVVKLLLEDPTLRARLAQAGKNYVETEYAWPAVIGRLADAFARCGLADRGLADGSANRTKDGDEARSREANR